MSSASGSASGSLGSPQSVSGGVNVNAACELYKCLGEGTYGQVYAMRDKETKQPSGRILKISMLLGQREIDSFVREVLYLQELQDQAWRKSEADEWRPLVPKLYTSKTHTLRRPNCPLILEGHQTMEQMDGTVTELGLSQARPFNIRGVAYTSQQFQEMITLTLLLDQMQIVHGDLKRKNLLYKRRNDTTQGKISSSENYDDIVMVLSDFGFTGMLPSLSLSSSTLSKEMELLLKPRVGFPDLPMINKKPKKGKKDLKQQDGNSTKNILPTHLWPYLNRWQMYFDFVYNRATYLIDEKNTPKKVSLLPKWVIRHMFEIPEKILDEFLSLYGLDGPTLPFPNTHPKK